MTIQELQDQAKVLRQAYDQRNALDDTKIWGVNEYIQGLMGDVGQLTRLVMAKENYRILPNVDQALYHELGDCLWALMCIANVYKIDLELAFVDTMNEVIARDKLPTQNE